MVESFQVHNVSSSPPSGESLPIQIKNLLEHVSLSRAALSAILVLTFGLVSCSKEDKEVAESKRIFEKAGEISQSDDLVAIRCDSAKKEISMILREQGGGHILLSIHAGAIDWIVVSSDWYLPHVEIDQSFAMAFGNIRRPHTNMWPDVVATGGLAREFFTSSLKFETTSDIAFKECELRGGVRSEGDVPILKGF